MKGLTSKQRQVLEEILRSLQERGMPPVLDEISEAIGVKSRFGALRHVRALEQKGYIRRVPGPRGIQVLRNPQGQPILPEEIAYLPLFDRITAGPPVRAREEVLGYVPVPRRWLKGGEGFAVRVVSDSMYPTVSPGDVAVVRRQPVATPGAIVVALLGEEAVLKRFDRLKDAVLLVSDNAAHAPMRFPKGEGVQLLGKVVGLLRQFPGPA